MQAGDGEAVLRQTGTQRMGVRVVLAEQEPVGKALRRLKKLLEREGVTWEIRRLAPFVKATELCRARSSESDSSARSESGGPPASSDCQ